MPTAATAGAVQQGQGQRRGAQPQTIPVVPFVRASNERREPAGVDISRQLTADGTQNPGVLEVPAAGYLRSILLVVTATGAVAGTLAENAPWTVLQNIQLTEPNGAVLSQFNDGYELYLANKWGGYRYAGGADPKASPAYSTDAAGNFTFVLRIPVELNLRDALGSIPNQNSAATFKLRLDLASGGSDAGLYAGTAPTTQPTVRIVAYTELWEQPASGEGGQTNQVTPPAMNTTQFWSTQILNVGAGMQTLRLTRLGNYIRNLIFVYTRTGGTRADGDADFPEQFSLYFDTRVLDSISKTLWRHTMYERSGYGARVQGGAGGASRLTPLTLGGGAADDATVAAPAAYDPVPLDNNFADVGNKVNQVINALNGSGVDQAGGLDAGVFVYDFTHEFDGSLGRELRDLWMPTLGSSRVEIQGNFANAGTLHVLTNDVAIAGSVFV